MLLMQLDEAKYKFCSTQINLNGTAATRVLMAADMLPDSVLGKEGRETQPHLTVQYGIEGPYENVIRNAVMRVRPFEITLGKTETFPPSKHSSGDSPLFVSVKAGTDKLVALRNAIRAVVPVRDSFPNYIPHVCVAYVRTDAASQYVGKDWLDGTVVAVNSIVFSNTEGEHVSIPLGRLTESTDDSVCVMDFAGSYNSKKHGRIYPFNCWADWYPQKKVVVFGGAYADVPDMPAAKEPTEAAVERWVKKHWKEEEWYPKYLKALSAAEESSPVVTRINSLLDRMGEGSISQDVAALDVIRLVKHRPGHFKGDRVVDQDALRRLGIRGLGGYFPEAQYDEVLAAAERMGKALEIVDK